MIVIRLPWTRPVLSLNDRLHRAVKAARTREVRETAGWVGKAELARLRPDQAAMLADPVAVTVAWFAPDYRRRDVDNLAGMGKPCLDGIVDAGLLADDDSTRVVQVAYRIEVDQADPRIEIQIRPAHP